MVGSALSREVHRHARTCTPARRSAWRRPRRSRPWWWRAACSRSGSVVLRGTVNAEDLRKRITDLVEIPRLVEQTLELDSKIAALARHLSHAPNFLYLGRGLQYPIALEGALKLKELSYIHAEGYAGGEMKHGPIALISDGFPVVALAPRDSLVRAHARATSKRCGPARDR